MANQVTIEIKLSMPDQRPVICVVRTPLQLFNVIEACQRFYDVSVPKHLIMVASSRVDLQMMQAMLHTDQTWQSVHTVMFQAWRKRLYGWQLNRFLQSLGEVQAVLIGMITHVPLHVVNMVKPKQVWIVDDGNESLMLARQMAAWREYPPTRFASIRDHVFGLKLNPLGVQDATFFSVFDLKGTMPQLDNDYRCFKQCATHLPIRPDVLVIGSNLVGTYLKSAEVLLRRLKHINQQLLPDVPRWYAPHRYESEKNLLKIEALGYQLYRPDCILEYTQIQQGWCFSATYSIRSTAVDTLEKIYNITGYLVALPQADFVSQAKWQECQHIWQQHPNLLSLPDQDDVLS